MRPIFHAELVNGPFGDPGVLVDLKFERRALLFDVGDVRALPTRKLLRISDVFVSHTHMDHFAGFDHLLRVCLGRDNGVRIYGPPGFIAQLEHKLAAYTWNLVGSYATDFVITAHEIDAAGRIARARFRSRARFVREPADAWPARADVLLDEAQFRVRCRALEHHDIVSLAYSFEEGVHVNVWKDRLEALQVPTGPWLTELKRLVRSGAADDTPVVARWRTRAGPCERRFVLGDLKRQVLEFLPGQKVCYVTDVGGGESNLAHLREFVRDADLLFIEAVFLDADREIALRKAHLTARAAGEVARAARVKSARPFHFSPRYLGRDAELRAEFAAAWGGTP